MKRALTVLGVTAGLVLVPAVAAFAHPLGNFTVNTYSGLAVQPDGVRIDMVLDMAEIPAFQERQSTVDGNHDGSVSAAEQAAYGSAACSRLAAGAALTVGGAPAPLRVDSSRADFLPGQAGLSTLRVECGLRAPARIDRPTTVTYRLSAYTDRVGWREITAAGDRTTLTGTDVPTRSRSARLTSYPADLLSSPLDVRSASLRVRPGGPALAAAPTAVGSPAEPAARGVDRLTRSFTALVARHDLTVSFGLLATLLAIVLGALHAFAPGHGKTVMAAYLVGRPDQPGGRRRAWRQAASIGITVTATHTAGVMVLGLALVGSVSVAPQRLYPWLGLISGLLLAAVGASLVRRPIGRRQHYHGHGAHGRSHAHGHHHGEDQAHPPGHDHRGAREDGQPVENAGGHLHGGSANGSGDSHERLHLTGHPHSHDHAGDAPAPHVLHAATTAATTDVLDRPAVHHHADGHEHQHTVRADPAGGVVGRGRLLVMGLVGGLVPSPSALVVLLGAVALGRTWFGVLLVVSYGLGMAACLVGLGALLARGGRLLRRADRNPLARRLGRTLPLLTSLVIVVVGAGLAIQAAAALLTS